jgi:hypothetical protein
MTSLFKRQVSVQWKGFPYTASTNAFIYHLLSYTFSLTGKEGTFSSKATWRRGSPPEATNFSFTMPVLQRPPPTRAPPAGVGLHHLPQEDAWSAPGTVWQHRQSGASTKASLRSPPMGETPSTYSAQNNVFLKIQISNSCHHNKIIHGWLMNNYLSMLNR